MKITAGLGDIKNNHHIHHFIIVMKKNRIIVALCPDDEIREKMIRKIAVKLGFANTEGDARKIIREKLTDYEIPDSYFILANHYSMRQSPETTQRLYRMALNGMAIVIGVKRIYPEHEFMCEIYLPEEIL